ncbi:hypothetical protein AKO1_015330 [Acrasis kona]|uniref:T-cell immunomodulatory protein TIP C2 domain-containing protein n=1 Tax=Acrasis kona TaxID=1008807 RepID=A0AAW2ZEG7_9EUKA
MLNWTGGWFAGAAIAIIFISYEVSSMTVFPPSLSNAPKSLFREDRFYDVTSYVALDNIDGVIAALGDFNNDKFQDIFIIGCGGTCVKTYVWNTKTWSFQNLPSAQINVTSATITNVVASDFNFDGKLDVMVTVKTTLPSDPVQRYNSTIYAGDFNSLRFLLQVPQQSIEQLLLVDQNGDTRVDLFGVNADTKERMFWINTAKQVTDVDKTGMSFELLTLNNTNPDTKGLAPYSTMYADVNGDCRPDLIIMSCSDPSCIEPKLEIWINQDKTGYELQTVLTLDKGSGRPTMSDMNMDGTLDLIIPVCYPANTCSQVNQIVIYYNIQPERSTGELCSASEYTFVDDKKSTFSLGTSYLPNYQNDKDPTVTLPNTIRVGDYDLDGYPDLILTVVDLSSPNSPNARVELVRNIACSDSTEKSQPCTDRTLTKRTFDNTVTFALTPSEWDGKNLTFALQGFLLDIDEKGKMDLIITRSSNNNNQSTITNKAYYNNLYTDGYFLKTIGLSGTIQDVNDRPYGVNMPGICYKFYITDMVGNYKIRAATQLTQTTHMSLQTPYHMFGLGRTNGYIEEFYLGKSSVTSGNSMWKMWSALMPNSQLVAIPSPAYDTDGWTVELFVDPSTQSIWVAVAVVGTLLLLGVPIIILYRYEAILDQREKRDKAHLISNVFIG